MKKRFFLDMGVMVGFMFYLEGEIKLDIFSTSSTLFLQENEGAVMVSCSSIMSEDMPKYLIRWKAILVEIRKKINDSDYEFKETDILYERDIKRAKKLFVSVEKKEGEEQHQFLIDLETIPEIRFDYIQDNIINDVVIPITEIDQDLRSHFQAKTHNFSDSKVIASAIQYSTKNKETVLVTTDYSDFQDIETWLRKYEKFDHYHAPKVKFLKKEKTGTKKVKSTTKTIE